MMPRSKLDEIQDQNPVHFTLSFNRNGALRIH